MRGLHNILIPFFYKLFETASYCLGNYFLTSLYISHLELFSNYMFLSHIHSEWEYVGWSPGICVVLFNSPYDILSLWKIRSMIITILHYISYFFYLAAKSTKNVSIISSSFPRIWFKPRKLIHWNDMMLSLALQSSCISVPFYHFSYYFYVVVLPCYMK